jgi:hypothetical protein
MNSKLIVDVIQYTIENVDYFNGNVYFTNLYRVRVLVHFNY